MFVIRKATFAAALIAALLSACAGGASEAPPPPLADAHFQRVFDAARSPNDVFQEDRNLTVVLERTDLTLDQRLKTLNYRAIGRSGAAENKNGAIDDYEEVLRLAPSDHPLVARVREELDYARQQKRYIEDRLAGRARSDDRQRFLDLLALGRHDEAVELMRQANIQPQPLYIEKLTKLGYLCEGSGYSGTNYQWGSSSTGYHVVFWCDSRGAPIR